MLTEERQRPVGVRIPYRSLLDAFLYKSEGKQLDFNCLKIFLREKSVLGSL